ncbi:MAG: translation elongation factor Ts [Fimbriimonadaceae bacterium]
MANYTAADVKRLREDTDAPMMECKQALDEADGDFDRAKQLLREKGKAAAAKRADRSTAEGAVAFAADAAGKTVGGVVLECETDFVANTDVFVALAQTIAEAYRDNGVGSDPLAVKAGGKPIKDLIEEAIGKIRENIRVAKAIQLKSPGAIETYVHHDRTKGAAVVFDGEGGEKARKLAIQVVSLPPDVVSKDQLSQEKIDAEIEVETQRAINEGKDEKMARNIATGRVNKEFVKSRVLLEQPLYLDPSKTVAQYLQEIGGGKVTEFVYLAVGGHS